MNINNLFETQIKDAKSEWEVKIVNESEKKTDDKDSEQDLAKETTNG